MSLKYHSYLFFLVIATFLCCYSEAQAQTILEKPKQVMLTGKVRNHDPGRPLNVHVNRMGFGPEEVFAKIDSTGNFMVVFDSYMPTDVWITYKTNFLILIHPGDSLHVEFDGSHFGRPEVLKSAKVMGSRAKTNQFAIKLQQRYYSDPIYIDRDRKNKATKAYGHQQYRSYLDTVKAAIDVIYERFVAEERPDTESKQWGRLFINSDYWDQLSFYVGDHREANNMDMGNDWDVPKGYYQGMGEGLPLNPAALVSGYALSNLASRFRRFVGDSMKDDLPEGVGVVGGVLFGVPAPTDSASIYGTIQYVRDSLIKQAMLTEYFKNQLEKQQINGFEQHIDVIKREITLPVFREPLMNLYLQTKGRIENPKFYTEAVLKELDGLSIKKVLDSIIQINKNKVIYIDVWATWCGPCLGAFPNSKLLEQQLKDKDVAFVYLCVGSQKPEWKSVVSKFQLGGQQYFLNLVQSVELNKLLGIKGIPFYVVIDKKGTIIEKGNQLSPLIAKDKILSLLE